MAQHHTNCNKKMIAHVSGNIILKIASRDLEHYDVIDVFV